MYFGGGKNRVQKKAKQANKKTGSKASGPFSSKHIRAQQKKMELVQKRATQNKVEKESNKKGGGYSYIVNPVTNRKVNVNGIIGQQIIRNYLQQINMAY